MENTLTREIDQLRLLISNTISEEVLEEAEVEVADIIQELMLTHYEFAPTKSLIEIFEQEKEYYKQHGMSALSCGYCGKHLDTEREIKIGDYKVNLRFSSLEEIRDLTEEETSEMILMTRLGSPKIIEGEFKGGSFFGYTNN